MTKIILQALFIAPVFSSISATFSTGADEESSLALSDLSSHCLVSNVLFSSQGWHKSGNEWRRFLEVSRFKFPSYSLAFHRATT